MNRKEKTLPAGRQRILNVATEEFANHGYDGTRIETIMRRSKVSKNLIYHYFHSKKNLFLAVLESDYDRLRFDQNWPDPEKSPDDSLRELIRLIFDHWKTSSRFIKLLASENFSKGMHIRELAKIREGYAQRIRKIEGLLERGVALGQFRPGVDATELYVSISSLIYHRISNRYTLSFLLGRDYENPSQLDACRSDVEHMVMAHVALPAPTAAEVALPPAQPAALSG